MADHEAVMSSGYSALVDEVPADLDRTQRAIWAVGYLYGVAGQSVPTTLRVTVDNVLGTVVEVDQDDGRKVGFTVWEAQGGRLVPVRLYER
jgi:hypothetical protein